MFLVGLERNTGDVVVKNSFGKAGVLSSTVRGNSIAVSNDGTVYVGGHLRGQTFFAPQLDANQTAAFVASFDADGNAMESAVYPGGVVTGEEAHGTSVALNGQTLFFAGTTSGDISIDGYPAGITSATNHPFLAQLDANTTRNGDWHCKRIRLRRVRQPGIRHDNAHPRRFGTDAIGAACGDEARSQAAPRSMISVCAKPDRATIHVRRTPEQSSMHRLAAVDVDGLAGHEVAGGRGQKHHRAHQVVRHLHALDGTAGDAGRQIVAR